MPHLPLIILCRNGVLLGDVAMALTGRLLPTYFSLPTPDTHTAQASSPHPLNPFPLPILAGMVCYLAM